MPWPWPSRAFWRARRPRTDAVAEPRNFALTLEYDGTDFEGWQRLPEGHRSVQAELERALAEISGHPVVVRGAGRTDAGVHARGQLAAASLEVRLDAETLGRAVNAKLPRDVVVNDVRLAPPDWNPRFAAEKKHYRYTIWNGRERSPLGDRYRLAYPRKLDLAAMAAAASQLEGRRDFASFQAAGSSVTKTVRSLFELRVSGESGAEIHLDARGDGFLRHMVRNLAGTLIEVGVGQRAPDTMEALLASRDRRQAGATAPAHGLMLMSVDAPLGADSG